MESESNPYPRTYRLKRSYFWSAIVIGLAITALGLWNLATPPPDLEPGNGHRQWSGDVLMLVLTAVLGAYLILRAFGSWVVLTADAVQVFSLFSRSGFLRREEIAGVRSTYDPEAPDRKPLSVVLVPNRPGLDPLKIENVFATDATFDAWMGAIPQMDPQTPAVVRARRIAAAQNVGAQIPRLAVTALFPFVLLMVRARDLRAAVFTVVLFPLTAVVLVPLSKGLCTFSSRAADDHLAISWTLYLPGISLAVASLAAVNLMHWGWIWLATPIVAAALVAFAALVDRALRADARSLRRLLILLLPYGFGAASVLDAALDGATPAAYRVAVLRTPTATSSWTMLYRLPLSPWGPLRDSSGTRVSKSVYWSAHAGDTLCVSLHSGALDAPWYVADRCPPVRPGQTAPASAPQGL